MPGARVRSGTHGRIGEVLSTPKRATDQRPQVWIRWDGDLMPSGYPLDHPVALNLQEV